MGVIIEESGMQFGEYEQNQVFQIEKCEQYTKSLRQNGIKTCEFILRRGKKLYFFEAKRSCPKQVVESNQPEEEEQKKNARDKYNEYIEEIVLKMRHSLLLYGNILLKRFPQENVPKYLANIDLSDTQIYLILVLNPKNGEWTPEPELRDDLMMHLKDELQIWKIQNLLVITRDQAKEKHFIL